MRENEFTAAINNICWDKAEPIKQKLMALYDYSNSDKFGTNNCASNNISEIIVHARDLGIVNSEFDENEINWCVEEFIREGDKALIIFTVTLGASCKKQRIADDTRVEERFLAIANFTTDNISSFSVTKATTVH